MSKTKVKMLFLPAIIGGLGLTNIAPMVKAARLFASHPNVQVTIITTIQTSTPFQTHIDSDRDSGHDIRFHFVEIPISEVGLTEDDVDKIFTSSSPNFDHAIKLRKAVSMLKTPILDLVREQLADCIVIDLVNTWAVDVALEGDIPLITFNASGLFAMCCEDSINRFKPHENVGSDYEPFVLPGMPDHVELTRSRLPAYVKNGPTVGKEFIASLKNALDKSYCVLINSFCELEYDYVQYYNNVIGKKCCLVGPLHCYSVDDDDDNNNNNIFEWLDQKTAKSVLYVSFGSCAPTCKEQFHEIAYGLEASGHPFIWVAKANGLGWFPEGFEARMRESNQGVILKTWAPQERILGHPSVGAFMTHCGWNSTLESLSRGVPVITWPMGIEQFYNECLMVDVLGVGIRVGNEEWMWQLGEVKMTVTRDKVDVAVKRMMDGDAEEVADMRKRVGPFVKWSKEAVQKSGSSYRNVCDLVEDLIKVQQPQSNVIA